MKIPKKISTTALLTCVMITPVENGLVYTHAQTVINNGDHSNQIAIVNEDKGVVNAIGETVRYSDQFLPSYNKDGYIVTSLDKARSSGYLAYVVVPSNFSSNVESINTQPTQSVLGYYIEDEAHANEAVMKIVHSSMGPICDEIIDMCNMLKQPNWHDENNEIYISVFGIADCTIDDDIQTASKDISLTKICSKKGIDINLLLDMLILVANDVKVNLDKIDTLVESVRETIRAMIFYPGEMEKINNNNKISYNTLKTIERELNNSLNTLDNFDSKSIKSKSITILKNGIREVIIPELQQLQIYYESISS